MAYFVLHFISEPAASGATGRKNLSGYNRTRPQIADTSVELGSAEAIEGVNSEIFSPLSPVAANQPAIGDKSIALDTTGAAERESGVFLARYDDLDMQICTIR